MADVPNVVPIRPRMAIASAGDGQPPLADRLAALLSELVDTPLVTLPGDGGSQNPHTAAWRPLELRLSHFKPDLAERAAALLEEAGW